MNLISYEAKEILLEKVKDCKTASDSISKRVVMRQEFIAEFNKTKIKSLTPEEYFPGQGKKETCMGYRLEWGTRPLGSIKGGSMAKHGPRGQFREIKDF